MCQPCSVAAERSIRCGVSLADKAEQQRSAVTPFQTLRSAVTPHLMLRSAVTPFQTLRSAVTPFQTLRSAVTPHQILRSAVSIEFNLIIPNGLWNDGGST